MRTCIDCGYKESDDSVRLCPVCIAALPFPNNYNISTILDEAKIDKDLFTITNKFNDGIQRIDLCDGKYIHCFDEHTGNQWAMRHGERWRDLTGDNFILALAQKIYELEKRDGY